MNNIWILAQTDVNKPGFDVPGKPLDKTGGGEATVLVQDSNSTQTQKERPGFGYTQLIFLGLMLVVFYFLLFRGPRKKQQEHKQMVQTLSKNDKVRTIGGIIGTIVDIKGDEITLKVDESNNTKIKIASSAIGKNLSKE
jgi:preprotein translocase subunit YajC